MDSFGRCPEFTQIASIFAKLPLPMVDPRAVPQHLRAYIAYARARHHAERQASIACAELHRVECRVVSHCFQPLSVAPEGRSHGSSAAETVVSGDLDHFAAELLRLYHAVCHWEHQFWTMDERCADAASALLRAAALEPLRIGPVNVQYDGSTGQIVRSRTFLTSLPPPNTTAAPASNATRTRSLPPELMVVSGLRQTARVVSPQFVRRQRLLWSQLDGAVLLLIVKLQVWWRRTLAHRQDAVVGRFRSSAGTKLLGRLFVSWRKERIARVHRRAVLLQQAWRGWRQFVSHRYLIGYHVAERVLHVQKQLLLRRAFGAWLRSIRYFRMNVDERIAGKFVPTDTLGHIDAWAAFERENSEMWIFRRKMLQFAFGTRQAVLFHRWRLNVEHLKQKQQLYARMEVYRGNVLKKKVFAAWQHLVQERKSVTVSAFASVQYYFRRWSYAVTLGKWERRADERYQLSLQVKTFFRWKKHREQNLLLVTAQSLRLQQHRSLGLIAAHLLSGDTDAFLGVWCFRRWVQMVRARRRWKHMTVVGHWESRKNVVLNGAFSAWALYTRRAKQAAKGKKIDLNRDDQMRVEGISRHSRAEVFALEQERIWRVNILAYITPPSFERTCQTLNKWEMKWKFSEFHRQLARYADHGNYDALDMQRRVDRRIDDALTSARKTISKASEESGEVAAIQISSEPFSLSALVEFRDDDDVFDRALGVRIVESRQDVAAVARLAGYSGFAELNRQYREWWNGTSLYGDPTFVRKLLHLILMGHLSRKIDAPNQLENYQRGLEAHRTLQKEHNRTVRAQHVAKCLYRGDKLEGWLPSKELIAGAETWSDPLVSNDAVVSDPKSAQYVRHMKELDLLVQQFERDRETSTLEERRLVRRLRLPQAKEILASLNLLFFSNSKVHVDRLATFTHDEYQRNFVLNSLRAAVQKTRVERWNSHLAALKLRSYNNNFTTETKNVDMSRYAAGAALSDLYSRRRDDPAITLQARRLGVPAEKLVQSGRKLVFFIRRNMHHFLGHAAQVRIAERLELRRSVFRSLTTLEYCQSILAYLYPQISRIPVYTGKFQFLSLTDNIQGHHQVLAAFIAVRHARAQKYLQAGGDLGRAATEWMDEDLLVNRIITPAEEAAAKRWKQYHVLSVFGFPKAMLAPTVEEMQRKMRSGVDAKFDLSDVVVQLEPLEESKEPTTSREGDAKDELDFTEEAAGPDFLPVMFRNKKGPQPSVRRKRQDSGPTSTDEPVKAESRPLPLGSSVHGHLAVHTKEDEFVSNSSPSSVFVPPKGIQMRASRVGPALNHSPEYTDAGASVAADCHSVIGAMSVTSKGIDVFDAPDIDIYDCNGALILHIEALSNRIARFSDVGAAMLSVSSTPNFLNASRLVTEVHLEAHNNANASQKTEGESSLIQWIASAFGAFDPSDSPLLPDEDIDFDDENDPDHISFDIIFQKRRQSDGNILSFEAARAKDSAPGTAAVIAAYQRQLQSSSTTPALVKKKSAASRWKVASKIVSVQRKIKLLSPSKKKALESRPPPLPVVLPADSLAKVSFQKAEEPVVERRIEDQQSPQSENQQVDDVDGDDLKVADALPAPQRDVEPPVAADRVVPAKASAISKAVPHQPIVDNTKTFPLPTHGSAALIDAVLASNVPLTVDPALADLIADCNQSKGAETVDVPTMEGSGEHDVPDDLSSLCFSSSDDDFDVPLEQLRGASSSVAALEATQNFPQAFATRNASAAMKDSSGAAAVVAPTIQQANVIAYAKTHGMPLMMVGPDGKPYILVPPTAPEERRKSLARETVPASEDLSAESKQVGGTSSDPHEVRHEPHVAIDRTTALDDAEAMLRSNSDALAAIDNHLRVASFEDKSRLLSASPSFASSSMHTDNVEDGNPSQVSLHNQLSAMSGQGIVVILPTGHVKLIDSRVALALLHARQLSASADAEAAVHLAYFEPSEASSVKEMENDTGELLLADLVRDQSRRDQRVRASKAIRTAAAAEAMPLSGVTNASQSSVRTSPANNPREEVQNLLPFIASARRGPQSLTSRFDFVGPDKVVVVRPFYRSEPAAFTALRVAASTQGARLEASQGNIAAIREVVIDTAMSGRPSAQALHNMLHSNGSQLRVAAPPAPSTALRYATYGSDHPSTAASFHSSSRPSNTRGVSRSSRAAATPSASGHRCATVPALPIAPSDSTAAASMIQSPVHKALVTAPRSNEVSRPLEWSSKLLPKAFALTTTSEPSAGNTAKNYPKWTGAGNAGNLTKDVTTVEVQQSSTRTLKQAPPHVTPSPPRHIVKTPAASAAASLRSNVPGASALPESMPPGGRNSLSEEEAMQLELVRRNKRHAEQRLAVLASNGLEDVEAQRVRKGLTTLIADLSSQEATLLTRTGLR